MCGGGGIWMGWVGFAGGFGMGFYLLFFFFL
jgi:hypothetical protein